MFSCSLPSSYLWQNLLKQTVHDGHQLSRDLCYVIVVVLQHNKQPQQHNSHRAEIFGDFVTTLFFFNSSLKLLFSQEVKRPHLKCSCWALPWWCGQSVWEHWIVWAAVWSQNEFWWWECSEPPAADSGKLMLQHTQLTVEISILNH